MTDEKRLAWAKCQAVMQWSHIKVKDLKNGWILITLPNGRQLKEHGWQRAWLRLAEIHKALTAIFLRRKTKVSAATMKEVLKQVLGKQP